MRIGALSAIPIPFTVNTEPVMWNQSDPVAWDPGKNVVSPGAGINPALVKPGTSNSATYGIDSAGDTLYCPPGFPYDAGIKDCKGYSGSPVNVTTEQLQAAIDACASGGGVWNTDYLRCINSNPQSDTIIPGVPDWALYAVGGVLALVAFKGMMGR